MTHNSIRSIKVSKLFDIYTYSVPANGQLENAAIIYGDNGVGKSTLLRLVYHLLSAAHDRGHRGNLFRARFESLEVQLSSGASLAARRIVEDEQPTLLLTIERQGEETITWNYRPNHDGGGSPVSVEIPLHDLANTSFDIQDIIGAIRRGRQAPHTKTNGERAYLEALSTFAPATFLLSADRQLQSDNVANPSDEVELRRIIRNDEPKDIGGVLQRTRDVALAQALSAAGRSISRRAIRGANQGEVNVHNFYEEIVGKLSVERAAKPTPVARADLLRRIDDVEKRTKEVSRFELATPLDMGAFREALQVPVHSRRRLVQELVVPYVSGLEGRLNALQEIYVTLDRFCRILNSMLRDKAIEFTLSRGFAIRSSRGDVIEPMGLSSGEQQLLLLFCHVLSGGDRPRVFMIDEPEISLNVKWQRVLIQHLLELTSQSSVQFILASHSMELLAQHRKRVVKLENLQ